MSEVKRDVLVKVLQKFNEDYSKVESEESRRKLGKILTIIDASIQDPEQRKAVKDLINNSYWDVNGWTDFNVHHEIRQLAEALGFDLYINETMSKPAFASDFNRYKELVK